MKRKNWKARSKSETVAGEKCVTWFINRQSVSEGENIDDTPSFGTKLNTEYILGMAKMEGGVKILLDID